MAGHSAILAVKILVDQAQAGKDMGKAGEKVSGFEKSLGKMTGPATLALGAIAGIGKTALDAASDTEQAMGAVESVFGDAAGKVKDWSDQAAKSAGLSKTDYANLAAVMGAKLKTMGLSTDKAADKTGELISLGADLAATFGGTTADAVGALSSALSGESEPAKKYGLALSQTAVQAQLAKDGTEKLTGAALEQAKASAIVQLATEQAAGSVGQFGRESDTAAGSAEVAKASMTNAASALGQILLPAAAAVAGVLGTVAAWMTENSRVAQILIGVVGGLAVAVLAVSTAMKLVNAATSLIGLATNPIGLVVLALIAVVAAVVLLWNKCKWFRDAVTAIWNAIRKSAEVAWNAISTAVSAVVKFLVGLWQGFLRTITGIWSGLSGAASTAWGAVRGVVQGIVDWLEALWHGFMTAISGIWSGLVGAARTAWDAIRAPIQAVIDWVASVWEGLIATVVGIWDRIVSGVTAALAPIRTAIDAIRTAWDNTVGAIERTIEKVKGWLGGITDKIGDIAGKIGGVLGKLNPFSKSAPGVPVMVAPTLFGRSAGGAAGPMRAQPAAGTAAGGNVYHFTINGAVDADGTARTISRILSARARRVGPVQLGGVLA